MHSKKFPSTAMQSERRTRAENATAKEMQLSNRAASLLQTDPIYEDGEGRRWPIVQRRNPMGHPPSFACWPGEFGVIGREGEWAVAHSEDGEMVNEGFGSLRDALKQALYRNGSSK
jgi:hypothetical protein